jgi:hypothetical protein
MRGFHRMLWIVAILAISVPSGLDSCAIAPPTPVFATSQRPADLRQFLAGKVGVLQRSYHRRYLIGAFRLLSGIPLTESEIASLYPTPPSSGVPPEGTPFQDAWTVDRAAFVILGPAPKVDAYKTVSAAGIISSFQNCHEDAFLVASETLSEVSQSWGGGGPKTLDWVRAQDQVFANCSSKDPLIPDPPQPNADPLFAAYRRYQIAAALFYSGQHRKASEAFDLIGADEESPWRGYGPYLAARALLRAGAFDHDREAFKEAERRLRAILTDPQLSEWHDASLRLLHLGQVQTEPWSRVVELSRELTIPRNSDDMDESAHDFLTLLDGGRDASDRQWSPSEVTEVEKSAELAAWLLSMLAEPPADAGERSVERWRKTRNPVWLISALANAPSADLPELLEAARQIPPTAAAYESVAYYAISREILQGHRGSARLWADQALAKRLQLSSRNLILARRGGLARNWNEFLRFGLRKPEPHIVEFEEHEEEADRPPLATGTAPAFDEDVIRAFNSQAPLSAWVDASENPQLPVSIQLRIAEAGWLRAMVLGRDAESRKLMARVAQLQPGSVGVVGGFLSARDSEEAKFAALYLVLRTPALRPELLPAQYETINLAAARSVATDAYGFRFGCWHEQPVAGMKQVHSAPASFLTVSQRDAGEAESEKILESEPWEATYLAHQTLEWARKHPEDPRIPEALHRSVIASYYRCTDENTGKYSKQAFDLLHRQYPKSEWAARTPYWYK